MIQYSHVTHGSGQLSQLKRLELSIPVDRTYAAKEEKVDDMHQGYTLTSRLSGQCPNAKVVESIRKTSWGLGVN
jgi:hypothetical protein